MHVIFITNTTLYTLYMVYKEAYSEPNILSKAFLKFDKVQTTRDSWVPNGEALAAVQPFVKQPVISSGLPIGYWPSGWPGKGRGCCLGSSAPRRAGWPPARSGSGRHTAPLDSGTAGLLWTGSRLLNPHYFIHQGTLSILSLVPSQFLCS